MIILNSTTKENTFPHILDNGCIHTVKHTVINQCMYVKYHIYYVNIPVKHISSPL